MKLFQIEHDNCEPYEDNFHFRESKVYTDKEKLIESILERGYEESIDLYGEQQFTMVDPKSFDRFDMITIHELVIMDTDTERD